MDARVNFEDAQELAAILACVPPDCSESAAWAVPLLVATARSGGITHPRRIAYLLATAQQASGFGARMVEADAAGKSADAQRYRGRGFVHISGRANYAAWSQRLGLPDCIVDDTRVPNLIADPDALARPSVAARTLVRGMRDGLFTGAALGAYVNTKKTDYFNARRVIDQHVAHAHEIVAHAVVYHTAMERVAAERHRAFLAEVTGRRAIGAVRDILDDVRDAVERLALRGEMLARPQQVLKWTGEARQGKFVQLDEQTCVLHMGRGVYVELDIARDLHGVVPPEGRNMALQRSGVIRPTLGSGRIKDQFGRADYDL